jgi:hypothetical protein
MAIRIAPEQIQNPQQIEVAVAGPEGANRLLTIAGQFDPLLVVRGGEGPVEKKETFTVLIGPALTRQQFFRAISSASLVKTDVVVLSAGEPFTQGFGWGIVGTDADWDDESKQVELRIEVVVTVSGRENTVAIGGLAFQVAILAAVVA